MGGAVDEFSSFNFQFEEYLLQFFCEDQKCVQAMLQMIQLPFLFLSLQNQVKNTTTIKDCGHH